MSRPDVTDAQPLPGATPDRPPRRWAFLATPGWIAAVAGALLFALACFAVLAPWQWDRHIERDAQNASITAAAGAPAVPVAELMTTAGQPAPDAVWHPVTATGSYLADATVSVRLRQDANGSPVSEVIVPLRLDDGSVLMVDRGYVPFEQAGSTAPVPAGRVTVTGRVQLDQTDPRNRVPSVQDGLLQAWAINGPQLTAATGTSGPVLGGYVQLVEGAPGVLVPIGVPQIDSGPFLSYAFQWIAFGVIAVLGMGFFVYREAFDPRGEGDEEDAGTPGVDSGVPDEEEGGRRSRRFDRSQLYDA